MFNLLNGLKIIDLTSIVLGPYATKILGDLGADVIKVEPLVGDLFRTVRPGHPEQMGAGFINCNRNKKSISINLKEPEGKLALIELIGTADVFVHNMRPSSIERLGLSYDELIKTNPELVYCFSAGFGQDGPYKDDPAYDDIAQAMSGLAFLNANAEGEPRYLPTIIGDKVSGLHLALAVLAAVTNRLQTGNGCYIEAPMFESMVSFLMVEQLAGQSFEPPLGGIGYERLLSPNRKPFRTLDGYISILPYNSKDWTSFLTLIDRTDISNAEWVTNSVLRSKNIDQLYKIISDATSKQTTKQWLESLKTLDIPCSEVKRMDELLSDPHLQEVNFFHESDHPTEGRLRSVRSPFRVRGFKEYEDKSAPALGEDTINVLQNAGLELDRIKELELNGIIRTS